MFEHYEMFEGLTIQQGICGTWVYQKNGNTTYNYAYLPEPIMIERLGGQITHGCNSIPLNDNLKVFMQDADLTSWNIENEMKKRGL